MDVFSDICEEVEYGAKSGCYAITNEYDEALRNWFLQNRDDSFAETFCYKELPNCSQEVHEASLTDIELENYEEDKDKIDPDFMPEASEEAVKKENEILERVKDVRDTVLDAWDKVDLKAKKWLLASVIGHPVLEPYLLKLLAREHIDVLATYWYVFLFTAFISALTPLLLVTSIRRRHKHKISHKTEKKTIKKTSTASPKKASSRKAAVVAESESEAVEADDEKNEEASVEAVEPKKTTRGRKAAAPKAAAKKPASKSPVKSASKSPVKSTSKSPVKRTSSRRA